MGVARLGGMISLALASTALAASPAYHLESEISGADGGWDFASVDPVHGKLYVARSNAVMAVDLATGAVTDRLAGADRGHGVVPLKNGQEVLETDGNTGLARIIDTTTGAVLAEIKTGVKPDAALFDAATGMVAVMNGGDGTVAVIDPVTRTLVGHVMVGGVLEFGVSDGRGTIWVNVEDKNELVAIDLAKRAVTARVALTGCDGPTGLAFVANGKRLLSACANGVAVVTDPKAKKVTGKLAIGEGPDAVLYDANRGLAFIPCGGNGVLEIIAADRPQVIRKIGQVATRISAKTGALDPRTGKIYLPSARMLPPEPGAKRGKPMPGSFAILVVSPTSASNSGSM